MVKSTVIQRSAKLAEIRAYRAELEAIQRPPTNTYDPSWYLFVPEGVVYVNALAGQVVMQGVRYWLADLEDDAKAATDV